MSNMNTVVVNVNGIGKVTLSNAVEYTSAAVTTPFQNDLTTLQTILNQTTGPTPAQVAEFTTAVTDLQNMAVKGKVDTTTIPGQATTYYLTSTMADNLGMVFNSLVSAGLIPLPGDTTSMAGLANMTNLIENWQGLAGFGVAGFVATAIGGATDATKSLQSMIELEYIKQGNDYINASLGNLENQVATTNQVLSSLTVVQNVINQVTVTPKSAFQFPPVTDTQIPSTAIAALESVITSTVNGPPIPGTPAFTSMMSQIANSENNAIQVANGLSGSPSNDFATEVNRIYNVNQAGASPPPSATDATAYSNLMIVINDYNTHNPSHQIVLPLSPVTDSSIPATSSVGEYRNPLAVIINTVPSLAAAAITDAGANQTSGVAISAPALQYALQSDVASAVSIQAVNPKMSWASALGQTQNLAAQVITAYVNLNGGNPRSKGNLVIINNTGDASPAKFEQLYQIVSSAQFTQVFPTATPVGNAGSSLLAALTSLKTSLASLLPHGTTVASSPNSLAGFVGQVIKDISARMINVFPPGTIATTAQLQSAVKAYIIDNQDQKLSSSAGFQAGSIQTNVTNAISAAQSANTQQQASVNNYEFVFQQFYTSAANVLSTISQTIQDTAQGIGKQ